MDVLFLKILNMSISASWLILVIILLRALLKKAPKWMNCVLWALVAVRLLCPISFESSMSLVPNPEPVPPEIFMVEPSETHTNTVIDPAVNPNLPDVPSAVLDTTIDMMQTKSVYATLIWMGGVAAMLAYAAISYIRVRRKVKAALRLRDRIWICDDIQTPFILGRFKPKIYIPSGTNEAQLPHIIAHENAHLKRCDHWWKPLGYLVLAVHWFNPLVWIAYILLCRDIELACDERVIRELNQSESISYSEALLSCSVNRRTVMICPLAFGEVGVKERVKRVLNYKKPAFWVVVVALLACIVVAVCFLTNPKNAIDYENHVLTFPVSDSEKTEYNEEIFEVEPFNIQFALPDGWSIGEYSGTEEYYLYSGTWSRVGIYDTHNELVGAVGYNICDDGATLDEPMSIYHQIALGNDYQFNVHDTYEIVKKSDTFETATVDVYHSQVLDLSAESETINYGIVTCHSGKSVYVAIELDSSKVTETQKNYVANSVEFPENLHPNDSSATQWFDYLPDPAGMTEDTKEISLPEYPGVTFHWNQGSVQATTDSETIELYTGMPIWNAFFCDLTGDGKPELCSTISFGSGIIDNRIIILDYAGGASYELEDRGKFDYSLRLENDRIYVDKKVYHSDELVETGYLSFANGVIEIIKSDSTISTVGGVDEPQRTDITVETELDTAIDKAIHEHYASDKPDGLIHVESYALLANEVKSGTPLIGSDNHMEEVTVYLLVFHEKYSTYGGTLESVGGSYIPTAITFSINESDKYTLKEYWEPRDGSDYTTDIRAKFPGTSAEDAFNDQAYIEDLQTQNYNKALACPNSTGGLDLRITELLDIIQSSPAISSNPGDYIDAHEKEYQELLDYSQYTLRYCFSEFLSGEQTDLHGHIMASLCRDIMYEMGEAVLLADSEGLTGQDWFDAFYSNAKELERQYSKEDLEKYYPASWLLLQMINE